MSTKDALLYSNRTSAISKTRWHKMAARLNGSHYNYKSQWSRSLFPRDATHAHWCLDSRNILSRGYGRPDFWWLPQIPQQKLTKFLSKGSSSVLCAHHKPLRSVWNASAMNEHEACQFSPTAAKNWLPQKRPLEWSEKKDQIDHLHPYACLPILKIWRRSFRIFRDNLAQEEDQKRKEKKQKQKI